MTTLSQQKYLEELDGKIALLQKMLERKEDLEKMNSSKTNVSNPKFREQVTSKNPEILKLNNKISELETSLQRYQRSGKQTSISKLNKSQKRADTEAEAESDTRDQNRKLLEQNTIILKLLNICEDDIVKLTETIINQEGMSVTEISEILNLLKERVAKKATYPKQTDDINNISKNIEFVKQRIKIGEAQFKEVQDSIERATNELGNLKDIHEFEKFVEEGIGLVCTKIHTLFGDDTSAQTETPIEQKIRQNISLRKDEIQYKFFSRLLDRLGKSIIEHSKTDDATTNKFEELKEQSEIMAKLTLTVYRTIQFC